MALVLSVLSYVFWVLLAITILVFVHEMGHFLTAKFFNMRVDRFSIGFPPVLFGRKIGQTEYVVGATPLGGYVKIAGMIDESLDADLDTEPEPYEYRAKPVWQRMIVISAGVIFNIILAAVIFFGLKLSYGEDYVPAENVEAVYVAPGSIAHDMGLRTGDRFVAVSGRELERFGDLGAPQTLMADTLTMTVERNGQRRTFTAPQDVMTELSKARGSGLGISPLPSLVSGVAEGSPAEEAGLKAGDRITALGGEPVRFWAELVNRMESSAGQPVTVEWTRPDSASAANAPQRYEARVTPMRDSADETYLLGVSGPTPQQLQQEYGVRHISYGVGEAAVAGVEQTWGTARLIVISLKRVFTGRDDFRESVGGPVAIARVTKEAADRGAAAFWRIVALLSITLAIMNFLPIPALDGGHFMFLLYEAITRRAPSVRVRMALQQVGMVVLILFMAFVIFNDIMRW